MNKKQFWSNVRKQKDGCWIWTGTGRGNGYGYAYYEGKDHNTHRLSWQLTKGAIPKGLFVCHACDVPKCVNPDHLWLGTSGENLRDASRKGCTNKGEMMHTHKLTAKIVLKLRAYAYERGAIKGGSCTNWGLRKLAEKYNVSVSAVARAARGETWRHVPMPPYMEDMYK